MKWEKIKRYFPIIGIALFIYLLIKLDVTKVFKEVVNLNLFYLLLAFLLVLVFFTTQTLKWFVIARKQRIKIPFKDAFKINLIGDFYGLVTPSKIGSVMRVDYLRDYGADTGKGLSNFIVDKVLDLTSLFILAIGLGIIFYQNQISLNYFYIIIPIFLAIIVVSLIFYKKESTKPILRFIYRRLIPKRFKEKSKTIFNSFYQDMPSLGFLFFVFLMNLINWIVDYAGMYFMGRALGINIGFIPFLAILPISTLVAQIPITISGLGTRELTMISLFGLFGVDKVKIFSMSILNILLTNVIPAFFTIFLIFVRKKNRNS
jgi:hypothetical protein